MLEGQEENYTRNQRETKNARNLGSNTTNLELLIYGTMKIFNHDKFA